MRVSSKLSLFEARKLTSTVSVVTSKQLSGTALAKEVILSNGVSSGILAPIASINSSDSWAPFEVNFWAIFKLSSGVKSQKASGSKRAIESW